MVMAVTLLPQPDSPTTPSVSPRAKREGDAVHGLDGAVHDVEVGAQVAHVEQHGRSAARRWPVSRSRRGARLVGVAVVIVVIPRVRGSSASRSPSPMKLMAMTVERDGHAGEERPTTSCPGCSAFWALASALPQLTCGLRDPEVEDSDTKDSSTMVPAISSVMATMTGPSALGRMWRNAMRRSPTPTARAASTKSASRSDRNGARTSRAMSGHEQQPEDEDERGRRRRARRSGPRPG